MANWFSDFLSNRGLLSGPALNPVADPEQLRQITGLLSQAPPAPGLAFPAGNMGYGILQDAATAGRYAMGNPDRLTTDQIIPSIANSAMALGVGGMPMAEAGAAGAFGGRIGKTYNPRGHGDYYVKEGDGRFVNRDSHTWDDYTHRFDAKTGLMEPVEMTPEGKFIITGAGERPKD
jgi:hypothetical protein